MIRTIIFGAAGRMGRRLIANIAENDDFQLVGAVEYDASPDLGKDAGIVAGVAAAGIAITTAEKIDFKNADAVINFATGGVIDCATKAVECGCAVVIGTTALTADEKNTLAELAKKGGRIVAATNMSVGVNLLFKLTREATKILGENYDVEIVEMHHNQKKDAPSGTAVTLAEAVCEARGWDYERDVKHGRNGMVGKRSGREIGMHSLRGGDVVGDHTVIFAINGERIELTHKASSRDTFARGALVAAKFLQSAPAGLYTMQDVLGLK